MTAEGEVVGPVQVVVLGIDARGSDAMISAELQDLATQSAIRIIDLLRVRREPGGEVRRISTDDPTGLSGAIVEALLFAGPGHRRDLRRDQAPIAPGVWFLADRVPREATVAILLLEHRWAIPLREAVFGFGAEVFGDAWLHPRDLEAARRAVRRT